MFSYERLWSPIQTQFSTMTAELPEKTFTEVIKEVCKPSYMYKPFSKHKHKQSNEIADALGK